MEVLTARDVYVGESSLTKGNNNDDRGRISQGNELGVFVFAMQGV